MANRVPIPHTCLLVALAISAIGPPAASGQTVGESESAETRGQRIALEVDRQREGFGDYRAHMTMVLRTVEGEEKRREMRIRSLEGGDSEKTLIELETPRDLRGTALLTFVHPDRNDDQWLYLPALKRVKRIAPGARSGSFMGSEFAYEDIASEAVENFDHRYLRTEELDGAETFVVERTPRDEGSAYARQLVWVDATGHWPLRIDYFDRDDRLFKTLRFAGYEMHGDRFWRPAEMAMVNHETGRSTTLIWSEYEFGTGLGDQDFDPRGLGRAR